MLEQILSATEPFPPHLHRHILQCYAMNHRRAPRTEAEQRRAVFEYLTRTQHDKDKRARVLSSPALEAWLDGEDEQVKGWAPVPRLAGLLYQFGRDLRRRYDLGVERDCKAFACYVALTLQGALRWPDGLVGERLRRVLWEPAPGFAQVSRVGLTRALNHVRRQSTLKHTDPARIADFSQILLSVLADIEQGGLPGYVLSPAQYEWLTQPIAGTGSRVRVTGLVHHLVVERGPVKERELGHADVANVIARELPSILGRLRLPRRVREAHAGFLPAAAAPPRAADEPRELVTVVGPLSHGSGLGAAARACYEALKAAGVPCEVINRKATWGPNDEHADAGPADRVRGDVNVIHFNPDTFIDNLSSFDLEQFDGRYNIGVFWWETSKACFAHGLGADLVDEVWVATPYLQEIFRQVTDKPVHVLRIPLPKLGEVSWATRACFELPEAPFTFVFTFDGFSRVTRKNPLGVVEAFQRAFPGDEGVQLVVKTQNTSFLNAADGKLYAELRRLARLDRRITVIDETFTSNEVHGLISVCDCYVSLHHSEGFGYGMAEAMKLRVPVIATAYSGNEEFTTEETAWPVRCRRVPVPPGGYFYEQDGQEWADPDLDHAAERLREVRTDPLRDEKVERACAFVTRTYDEAVVGRLYRERIEAIRAARRAEAVTGAAA